MSVLSTVAIRFSLYRFSILTSLRAAASEQLQKKLKHHIAHEFTTKPSLNEWAAEKSQVSALHIP